MIKKFFINAVALFLLLFAYTQTKAQSATMLVNSDVKHQKITGFGGFVNSPQFGYNHMTTAEIRKLWGKDSEMGYNIMRLYIPIGENNWSQARATAVLAQSLGIKIFASPWSMPANWKTNNSVNAVVTVNGVEKVGYLKEEHYEDYANYLNNFVKFLRGNGVELVGISIQNEPDYGPTYAGCLWTPQQMAKFIKEFGHIITCPIIAAEGVGITDNYANAFLAEDVLKNLGIFGGHQYGKIQSAHKKLQEKGKEVWMTEFLINWNADRSTPRNFNWSIDAFDFAKAINTALKADINAWIHYASKRYYGMMGDGTNGTQSGVITKQGYILSHFAKYATGTTRIQNTWKDGAAVLDGTSYLSVSGDSVIVMVINTSNNAYSLTVDLPFNTQSGTSITTTAQVNMENSPISLKNETYRPKVTLGASSFTTFIFKKSGERTVSEMVGLPVYNNIDFQIPTNTSFGTSYKLSGKTVTFDNANPLISNFTNSTNGYLGIDDRYTKLVFNIQKITTAMTYTSANTTLYYINNKGLVKSHNYGTINFNQSGSSQWILDISRKVLTEGCAGIIGLRNGNYSSVLTITFGDVYLMLGDEKMYEFSGPYTASDSYLLDCLDDISYTSLDFTKTTGITADLDWHQDAANQNCIFYVGGDIQNNNTNVVRDTICNTLKLSDQGGDFYFPKRFSASTATYTATFSGHRLLVLPFTSTIPQGAKAYMLEYTDNEMIGTSITDGKIPSNTPVLIAATGTFTFEGSGEIDQPKALTVNNMNGVYVAIKAPTSTYSLLTVGGVASFQRVTTANTPTIKPFSAYLDMAGTVSIVNLPIKLDDTSNSRFTIDPKSQGGNNILYDLWGRPIHYPQKGVIYIKNGQKIVY